MAMDEQIFTEEWVGVNTLNVINCNLQENDQSSSCPIGFDVRDGGSLNVRYVEMGIDNMWLITGSRVFARPEPVMANFEVVSLLHRGASSAIYYYLDGTPSPDDRTEWDGSDPKPGVGCDAYPMNSTMVPTTNRREVGSGKTYATPRAAYDAASDGDNIIIYPGTYAIDDMKHDQGVTGLFMTKNVRLYGSTQIAADVILTYNTYSPGIGGNDGLVFDFENMTTAPGTPAPGVSHLTIKPTASGSGYTRLRHIVARSNTPA